MNSQEIERKFLVIGNFKDFSSSVTEIKQGFLSTVPERTVRVRIMGEQAFLTIKGIGNHTGISRFEWEKEIKKKDALKLLEICEPGIVEKKRYIIETYNDLYFEVDVFEGSNQGLVIAELELPTEETLFSKPDWLGKEVTGQIKYYNSNLVKNPYTSWGIK